MVDYNKAADVYATHRRIHPAVFEGLMSGFDAGSGTKVLEIGCGTGNYIVALEEATGASCYGVDPAREMLEKAKARTNKVKWSEGRAEALGLDKEYFDFVFIVDVIHNVRAPLDAFIEAHRVLKKGKKICTATDSEWIIKNRLMSKYWPETVDYELRRYHRVAELRIQMKAAGFAGTVEKTVEMPFEVDDIGPYQDKAFSALRLIPEHIFKKGLERLEADLEMGPVRGVSRYLLLWGEKLD